MCLWHRTKRMFLCDLHPVWAIFCWYLCHYYFSMPRIITIAENIASVTSLYKANHKVHKLAEITGMCHQKEYHLIQHFQKAGETYCPVPNPNSGGSKITSQRTWKVIAYPCKVTFIFVKILCSLTVLLICFLVVKSSMLSL